MADSTPVITIIFTVEDIENIIDEIDEIRGSDGDPPLDHGKAMTDVLSWASAITDNATQRIDSALSSVIQNGMP